MSGNQAEDDTFMPAAADAPAPSGGGGDGWFDRMIQGIPAAASRLGNALGGGEFGIADLTPEQRTNAGNRALLNFGLNMLANSGYSPHRRGVAEIFAGGAQAAQQSLYATEQGAAQRQTQGFNTQIKLRQLGILEQDRQLKLMLLKEKLDAYQRMRGINVVPGSGDGADAGGGTTDAASIQVSDEVPAAAKPLLQLIAARESGGRPNVYYGNTTFDDLSKFPDWPGVALPDGRRTHAAGKYQFQPGTWQRTAGTAGITDFSEVNQDRAAYVLASGEYRRRTGRELTADLQDPGRADGVLQTLTPHWPVLKGLTAAALPRGGSGSVQVAGPGVPTSPAGAGGTDQDDTFFPPPVAAPAPGGSAPTPAPQGQGAAPLNAPAPGSTPPELDPMDAEDARAQARIDRLRKDADRDFRLQERLAKASADPSKALPGVAKGYEERRDALNKEQLALETERRKRKDTLAAEGRTRAAEVDKEQRAQQAARDLKAQEHQQALELERQKAESARAQNFETAALQIDTDKLKKSSAASQSARNQLSSLEQLEVLLPSLGGPNYLAQTYPQVYKIAQTLGMGPESINQRIPSWQAFSAIINRVAGEMRPEGSGALSDRELDIYKSAFPELSQSDEGRRLVLSLMKTAAIRKQQEHEYREEFFQNNKTTANVGREMDKPESQGGLGFMIKRPPPITGDAKTDGELARAYVSGIEPGTVYFVWDRHAPPGTKERMTWAIQGNDRRPIYAGVVAPASAEKLRPSNGR